jgi:hypothetical protein
VRTQSAVSLRGLIISDRSYSGPFGGFRERFEDLELTRIRKRAT